MFDSHHFLSNKSSIHFGGERGKGNMFLNGKWHVQNKNGHRSPRSQTSVKILTHLISRYQLPLNWFFNEEVSILFCIYLLDQKYISVFRGGHRHLQIGRMLDINLISEPPPPDVCIQSVGICVARRAGSDSYSS